MLLSQNQGFQNQNKFLQSLSEDRKKQLKGDGGNELINTDWPPIDNKDSDKGKEYTNQYFIGVVCMCVSDKH